MRRKLVSAIDGIRNLHLHRDDDLEELEVDEKVATQHCSLATIVRHGFPDEPRCLAYDPVQRLLAIGASRGCVRLLGQAGVDFHLKHQSSEEPVLFIQFLVNEGGLITALRDDSIHLWNYRQKTPEIVHSLKMAKERVSCIHLPFQSKWLHVGTDKGNVYFICLANFELSTYVINWNKAIDVSCRTHPGAVKDLSLCPTEPFKLLMVYEKGHVVLWNIATREVERFGVDHSPAKCVSWHYDGRQFMCGHKDGSLTIWNIKKPKELVHKTTPHSPNNSNACRPITHLSWSVNADTNEQLIVFAGGMPTEEGVLPALTVVRAKGSITVLEMDHPIVEICALNALPFNTLAQLPYGIAVLLKEDLLVIDMSSPGYPCFESPYPMDIHESPVTFLSYYAECPVDLIAALTLVGRNQRKQGVRLSDKAWPLTGGVDRECASGHQEMLLTGHEDGSIKFWQASSENLQVMYKLKTGRHFEKSSPAPTCSASSEEPARTSISHAVTGVELCLDSRLLMVAGASGQVTLFRFVKTESSQDIAVVVLPQLCSSTAAPSTPPVVEEEALTYQQHLKPQRGASSGGSSPSPRELRRQQDTVTSSRDSHSTDTSFGSQAAEQMPIKVRGGAVRRPAGYQPELVCQIPWNGGHTPERISAIALSSAYGVLAIGTSTGVALVDILASTQIYAWSNAELHNREGIAFSAPSPSAANIDISSPSENMHYSSSMTPPPPSAPSAVKAFMRLNTENKQRSIDRPRPLLSKAQSMAVSYCTSAASALVTNNNNNQQQDTNNQHHSPQTDNNCNGELREDTGGRWSRSSSTASLDKLTGGSQQECVTSLTFINCYSKKASTKTEPCLWLGTSKGACIAFNLIFPFDRVISNVVVAPSGSIVRLQERILCSAFLDKDFCIVSGATETFKDVTKESAPASKSPTRDKSLQNKAITKPSQSPTLSNQQEGIAGPLPEELYQLGVFVSEQEIRVLSLPGYSQYFHYRADIPLIKAKTSHISGYPVLICLNAAGQIQVMSLPSLKLIYQAPLFRCSVDLDDPVCQKTDFSEHGLGMYMVSQTEVQKFTVNSELASQVAECSGELFVPCDMPEPPKASFFRGVSILFTGASQKETTDLDSILSEKPSTSAVSSMKSVARQIPGCSILSAPRSSLSSMEAANSKSITAGQAANMAIQNLNERGERLNAVVDATDNLRNNAMNMYSRSSKLVEKYEKKKWYHL